MWSGAALRRCVYARRVSPCAKSQSAWAALSAPCTITYTGANRFQNSRVFSRIRAGREASRPRKRNQNKACSPAIKIIAGEQLPKPEKSRTQNGSAQRPEGIGHTMPAPSKDSGPISAFALNRPIIFQLAIPPQQIKTDDLRASETRHRPPTPWAMLQPVV